MKKYLTGFIVAIISIIPISNVKALTGNDGVVYPDIPDSYTNFVIVKHYEGQVRLFTFDERMIYSATYAWNSKRNVTDVYFYGCSSQECGLSGNSEYPFSYNYYTLSSGKWVLQSENVDVSVASSTNVSVLLSTENFYMNPSVSESSSTYPEGYYYISGYHEAGDLTYESDFSEEYLTFSYEKIETENNSYYDFLFSVNDYNSDYAYRIKFNDEAWRYIYNDYYTYQILYNGTIYMEVLNENDETIESKTFTISDLISKDDFYSPTIDIDVGCSTDFYTNIEQAKINLTFNNYSTNYTYYYSFDDINYVKINYSDIKNKKYEITSHVNGSIFVKILDSENNLVYKNSARIDCILDSEDYYYYELTIDDLYNSEQNELIFYTFYYENKKRDITPFVYFYYLGSDSLNFHITYNTNAIDLPTYNETLMTKTLEDLPCTILPFEYIDNTVFNNNFTSYTVFSFMPCIDLSTFLYGEQYTDFKLIVKSNLKLDIGEPISFGGNFVPSTNKPIDDSNSFQSNFTNFFQTFNAAFERFKNVIIEIFEHCTYFFNNVSLIVQDFFIVVFVLILCIFLIRFIL